MANTKQLSKTVADRLSFGDQVRHAIRVQKREVVDAILQRAPSAAPFQAALEGAIDWLDAELGAAGDRLREADLAHSGELADDGPARAARDEAAAVLAGSLANVRSVISGTYGAAFVGAIGLAGALATRADQLATQGTHVARQLRTQRAPSPVLPGARIDLEALAADIETKTAALEAALADVRREEREAQTTLSRRDAVRDDYARTYSGVSEIFAGLCTLAGLDDLASKVRPTARRRAGIPDTPSEPAPAEPTAGS